MSKYSYYAKSIFELLTGFENWAEVVGVYLGMDNNTTKEPGHTTRLVRLRQGLQFKVRGKMDIWSLKEALIDRFYEAQGFEPQDGWTVVDIGAGIGEFTLYAAADNPTSRVIACEPFPESYALLCENLALNAVMNVQCCQKAVWSQTGRLQLDLSGGEPLQLISQAAKMDGDIPGTIQVDCLSLADVITENTLNRIDLLKLDCEGAEYNILLGSEPDTLARIQRIVMEYHDNGPHNHTELVELLQRQGYQVRTIPNQVHAELGYLFALRQ